MKKLGKIFKPFLNWKFLLSFGLSYVVVNCWSYVFIWLGIKYNIVWMTTVGTTWATIGLIPNGVWILCSLPLAIFLQTKLFPKDEKLKQQLNEMREEIRGKRNAKEQSEKTKN